MKISSKMFTLIFIFSIISLPQELYHSREFKTALTKNTRTTLGTPGKNYWQNKNDFKINAEFDPKSRLLTGEEEITYYNNSQDTLKNFVFKMFQNFYRKDAPRENPIDERTYTDGFKIEKFSLNSKELDIKSSKIFIDQVTNLIIKLPEPIAPKSKNIFVIKYSFTLPEGVNIRIGKYDSSTYFIGYWFPRPAVYDDITGWDAIPYDGQHEFYNEYGSYDISLKVPSTFGVWGTGTLLNPKEVLNVNQQNNYLKAMKSDSVVKIISKDEITTAFNKDKDYNVWKFKADDVTDFAFGLTDHYVWDAASIKIGANRVLVSGVYNPANVSFEEVVKIARKTIEDLSFKLPGVPYVYPQITVFNGDDGMEFPMIVNDGELGNRINDVYVTAHEISHEYFPFIVGTNETKNAWLDEGMAYFLPIDIQYYFEPYDHRIRAAKTLGVYLGREKDVPMMTPSYFIKEPDLSVQIYYKPAIAYNILRELLGVNSFNKALQTFINEWKFKHPAPYDFFYTFNTSAGKNLNWFFKKWFFEQGSADLRIEKAGQENNILKFTIKNVGGLPVPVVVKVKSGENEKEFKYSPEVWKDSDSFTVEEKVNGKVESIILGNDLIPDATPQDNTYQIK